MSDALEFDGQFDRRLAFAGHFFAVVVRGVGPLGV